MAKFAKGEEKLFDPISNKVLSAIASPIGSLPEEEPSPASVESEEAMERPPEPPPARTRATPERLRVVGGKRPAPKRRVPITAKSERLSKAVKCLFTPAEEQELRALVGRLATEVNFSLTLSHLMRPYFELLLHCEEQLTNEIRRAGLTRPINEKTAIALFENVMAEAIHAALRKTSQFRAERREGDDR